MELFGVSAKLSPSLRRVLPPCCMGPQRWISDNPSEDTASLLSDGRVSKLRLCLDGKPLDLKRSLYSAVTSGMLLELLPERADGDGESSGSDAE
jgi:hypothetical protein